MSLNNGPTLAAPPTTLQQALIEQAATMQEKVDTAQRQLVRAQLDIDRLQLYVSTLNAMLLIEGLKPVSLRDGAGGSRIGKAGNRVSTTPPRKPEYEHLSLADSIELVLGETQEQTHANVLVEKIYEISSATDMKYAKRSLVSSARHGAKKGRWKAIEGNYYRAKQPEMQLN